ncbi:MAG: PcfB family protein [Ruminococcaceae bacterium]|nr:PcfB family protein [Oscillospiraceae bacterium]
MSNGGDAAEQVIKISLDGVDYAIRIAGAGAKNLIAPLMALAKSKKSQPPQLKPSGKERLKRMIKSGSPLDVFPVREQDIRAFTQEAKKYGIVYCAVRDKEPKPDGMVDVLVRKEDSPKINRVITRLQYATVDKTSIKS